MHAHSTQGLSGAPRLKRLLIRGPVEPAALLHNLPILQSLPALEQLQFEKGVGPAELEALHAGLPRLRHPITAAPGAWRPGGAGFLEAALACS